jgi:hypothetical protein
MLVQGSTASTSFVPYYTGLKHVELNSVNVYGKTHNYTELRVGDKVKAIVYSKVDLDLGTSNYWNLPSWDNADGFVYWSGSSQSLKFAGSKLPIGVSTYDDVEANKVYVFDDLVTISTIHESVKTIVKNATSIKSILPSSILPKTLAEYERLEVVDNGDDTYKIDLVSHAELHVGDEINSLWVGNPQSENYTLNWSYALGGSFSDGHSLYFRTPESSNAYFNRIFTTLYSSGYNSTEIDNQLGSYLVGFDNYIKSPQSLQIWFGGDDSYISNNTTNRNAILKFTANLTITNIHTSSYFNSDFRNGEETRVTLINGLSLDDVSAVIDTDDIVCADNSNAEYDVSIAETSVELLVNKNEGE